MITEIKPRKARFAFKCVFGPDILEDAKRLSAGIKFAGLWNVETSCNLGTATITVYTDSEVGANFMRTLI